MVIGYGNNAKPDGTFGYSTIVEYSMDGKVLHKVRVKGRNDGLKVDPKTNLLWALQNEDARPNLVIFDRKTWKSTKYAFANPPTVAVTTIWRLSGTTFISARPTPRTTPIPKQAIVKATLVGDRVAVTRCFSVTPSPPTSPPATRFNSISRTQIP